MLTPVDVEPQSAQKRTRFFVLLALAPLMLLAAHTFAAPITVPTILLPGDQYRLAFVTAGTRTPSSSNIADYDAFVQAEANTEAALSSISWQVIGSTATVDADVHTGTDAANFPGLPIFLLNDIKLVDNYLDLWDGSVDVAFGIDQHGNARATSSVWTGTTSAGNTCSSPVCGLGDPQPGSGWNFVTSAGWILSNIQSPGFLLPMYAISEVLTVPVPEASPMALLTLGFAALLLARRTRPQ